LIDHLAQFVDKKAESIVAGHQVASDMQANGLHCS